MIEEAKKEQERRARVLRERIYGPIDDDAWAKVKNNWVKDIVWLERTAAAGIRRV